MDRIVADVADRAEESARVEIEDVNQAISEIPDEQTVAEAPKSFERRPCHAPGRIERAVACEASDECSVGLEDVDETVSVPGDIVFLVLVLLRLRDVLPGVDRGVA